MVLNHLFYPSTRPLPHQPAGPDRKLRQLLPAAQLLPHPAAQHLAAVHRRGRGQRPTADLPGQPSAAPAVVALGAAANAPAQRGSAWWAARGSAWRRTACGTTGWTAGGDRRSWQHQRDKRGPLHDARR